MYGIESKVLNALLDQYEKSKSFSSPDTPKRAVRVCVSKIFPKYTDSAEYDFYNEVNSHLSYLEEKGVVTLQKENAGAVKNVLLNTSDSVLPLVYASLNRTPKKEINSELLKILDSYCKRETVNTPLYAFILEQKERIAQNKSVEHFKGDIKEFEDILRGAEAVLLNDEECFIRDFSMKVYKDSKRFEKLQSQITSVLLNYGDFEDKDEALSEYGIVKTPTYVCVKGNARIALGEQEIDLSKLNGDIAFSTQSLKEISSIRVYGERIVTIENLTSFHTYKNASDFVIYLAGFHNKVKRDFICSLYEQNVGKQYVHFGDIDAGGFYILQHLKKRTGIPFRTIFMDIKTLQKYSSSAKPLTKEDKCRLEKMIVRSEFSEYKNVMLYMCEHNIKLEQEAVEG